MPALVPLAILARRSAHHALAKLDPARAQLVEHPTAELRRKPLAEEQQAAEGATASSQDPTSNKRRRRSATREGAVSGPARASGRASTRPFPPFPPNDPRSILCHNERQRQHLARYKVRGGQWPPFLPCDFRPQNLGITASRKAYRDQNRGMTPVITASGQGTLWVGDMDVATNAPNNCSESHSSPNKLLRMVRQHESWLVERVLLRCGRLTAWACAL